MAAYYNEHDRFAAAWLRELIKAGLIADGDVDERSIEDVVPSELAGYTQCHFFAGIGVWSYALRQAGWPDDRPVWTGSCPCQPFSSAGKGAGFADERHLWPAFYHLIRQCRPGVVFGEQVASKDGLAWLDVVQSDLEGADYAVGAVDTCAAGFGAPHIRQRLYWVADSQGGQRRLSIRRGESGKNSFEFNRCGAVNFLADSQSKRREPFTHIYPAGIQQTSIQQAESFDGFGNLCAIFGSLADASGATCQWDTGTVLGTQTQGSGKRFINGNLPERLADGGSNGELADAASDRRREGQSEFGGCASGDGAEGTIRRAAQRGIAGRLDYPLVARLEGYTGDERDGDKPGRDGETETGSVATTSSTSRPGPTNGFWGDTDWLFCRDGKWRAVEPGTFPLVDVAPARVGRLRGYGNAIVAVQAEAFIKAYLECLDS